MATYLKDPDANLDYTVDWRAGYLGTATIITSSWTVLPVEPGGVTIAGEAQAQTHASVNLTGGIPGHLYRIGNQVVLSDGTIDERSITVRVEQR